MTLKTISVVTLKRTFIPRTYSVVLRISGGTSNFRSNVRNSKKRAIRKFWWYFEFPMCSPNNFREQRCFVARFCCGTKRGVRQRNLEQNIDQVEKRGTERGTKQRQIDSPEQNVEQNIDWQSGTKHFRWAKMGQTVRQLAHRTKHRTKHAARFPPERNIEQNIRNRETEQNWERT